MITKDTSILLRPREDGGLQVYSLDHPGLILSGSDPAKIMAAILPAIDALERHIAIISTAMKQIADGDFEEADPLTADKS